MGYFDFSETVTIGRKTSENIGYGVLALDDSGDGKYLSYNVTKEWEQEVIEYFEYYEGDYTMFTAGLYLIELVYIDTSWMTACGWEYDYEIRETVAKNLDIV